MKRHFYVLVLPNLDGSDEAEHCSESEDFYSRYVQFSFKVISNQSQVKLQLFQIQFMSLNQKELLSDKQVTKFNLKRNQGKADIQKPLKNQPCPINFIEKLTVPRNKSINQSKGEIRNNTSCSKPTKQMPKVFIVHNNQQSSFVIENNMLKQQVQVQSVWVYMLNQSNQSCQQYQIQTPTKKLHKENITNNDILNINLSNKSVSVLKNAVKHTFDIQVRKKQYVKVLLTPQYKLQKVTIQNKSVKLVQLTQNIQKSLMQKGVYTINPFQLVQEVKKLINIKLSINQSQSSDTKNNFIQFVDSSETKKQRKSCNINILQTPKVKSDQKMFKNFCQKHSKEKVTLSSSKKFNCNNISRSNSRLLQKYKTSEKQKSFALKQASKNKYPSDMKRNTTSNSSLFKNTTSSASKQIRTKRQSSQTGQNPKSQYFYDSQRKFAKNGKTIYPKYPKATKQEKNKSNFDQQNASPESFYSISSYGVGSSSSKKNMNEKYLQPQKLLQVKQNLIQSRKL